MYGASPPRINHKQPIGAGVDALFAYVAHSKGFADRSRLAKRFRRDDLLAPLLRDLSFISFPARCTPWTFRAFLIAPHNTPQVRFTLKCLMLALATSTVRIIALK